jgi:hypothetical protein
VVKSFKTLVELFDIFNRMEMDRRVCMAYLISVCIRIFLERRERELSEFVAEFKSASASDEKIALMERFLSELWSQLETDSTSMMWSLMVSEDQQVPLEFFYNTYNTRRASNQILFSE